MSWRHNVGWYLCDWPEQSVDHEVYGLWKYILPQIKQCLNKKIYDVVTYHEIYDKYRLGAKQASI